MIEKKIEQFYNHNHFKIGQITYTICDNKHIYCEMIEIEKDYRQQGWATYIIDTIREKYDLPFRYSIVSDNCLGAKFWNKYTKNKQVQCLFGHTFEIKEDI